LRRSGYAPQRHVGSLTALQQAGTADSRDVTEALTWAKTNRDTLRRLWREYSE